MKRMIYQTSVETLSIVVLALAAAFTAFGAGETGKIKCVGKPGDAGVFIDGKYVGPASRFTVPESYEAPAGTVEVSLKDPRYEDFTQKVTVRPKKKTKLHYAMKKLPDPKGPFGLFRLKGGESESFISVAAGDTSPIYINDKFYGHVDELNNLGSGILLQPGTYDLRISSPIFGEINQKLVIEANKTTYVPITKK